jgi:serine/threonine protein kinase
MRAANVVHFDLKGDNILLEPLPGCSEDDFWAPTSSRLPFNVVLADFGESKIFSALDADITVRCSPHLLSFSSITI